MRRSYRSPIHVCSLSMSVFSRVNQELQEAIDEVSTHDPEDIKDVFENPITEDMNRLQWVKLCMQANRQTQLQYVLHHLGNKSNSPKFRAVRMRPAFHAMRREVLRDNWRQIRDIIDMKALTQRMGKKKDTFASQRAELAARYFSNMERVQNPDLDGLVAVGNLVEAIDCFMTPNSCKPGFHNQFLDYCASSAVKTISEIPLSVEEEDWVDSVRSVKGLSSPQGSQIDEEDTKEKALVEQKFEEKESKGLYIVIFILFVLIAAIAVYLLFGRIRSNQERICDSNYPDKTSSTVCPGRSSKTKKRSWF